MQPPGGGGKSGIQRCQGAFQARMEALVNGVDLGIVGNAFECDVGHGFVDKTAAQPFVRIAQGEVVKAGGHQPLFGQRNGDARGVAGNPAAAPFFGDVGGGSAAAGGVEYQVAGVGGHQNAAFDNAGIGLHDINFLFTEARCHGISP